MSFWNLSDGEAVKSETEYEAPSGGGEPLPHNTDVLGYIDQIGWAKDRQDGAKPIEYRVCVAKPEAYKNRKLFFKLWPLGDNPNKQGDKLQKDKDKSLRFLAAIDANSGGELLQINGVPSDEDLQSNLMQKMMVWKVGKYEMEGDDGQKREGNYLMAVSGKDKGVSEPSQNQSAPASQGSAMDDEIPFAPEWRI